jgi:ectoine hydroxylase-related dioxygenase (phytanoyl-CoA dioxygenase family)
MLLDFETDVTHPRVSMKVGFFLSDVSEPGRGNLCVVPGSHRTQHPQRDGDGSLVGGIEVLAAPGDAVVFDRRIWHSASTNTWSEARKALFYGYSYRWLRPKSAMDFGSWLDTVDPIRRQLLGWATSANGYFEPQDADVPLRAWIRDNLGPDAVAP